MPDNKLITALPGEVMMNGAKWCRTSELSESGMYSWAQGDTKAAVDLLFKAGPPPHYSVSQSNGGWVRDVHFSDGASRIFFFRPKTPWDPASCGWGVNIGQLSPYRKEEAKLKQGLGILLTQFGIEHFGLLDVVQVAPAPVALVVDANPFPTLAEMMAMDKKKK